MTTQLTTFTRAGLEFDVVDSGPSDGPVIVALHGFPQTATSLQPLTALLNARGYRTVTPNQRGYSPGARPAGRLAYRVPELVDDVVALIADIDRGPVHLVGHDWGAMVAWSLAAARPELVRTLVTVSVPHPGALARSMVSSDQLLRSYYMALFQLPVLPERVLRARPARLDAALAKTGMSAEAIARVHSEIVDSGALTSALNWYRALAFTTRRTVTKRVTVPVTHVWSTGDTALNRRGAELTGDYVTGDYRLAVLDGSHWLPEERPDELATLIADRVESLPG
ncbi:alpha/beta fold hydrolase [Nocardia alba]|uniref:Pimeloyl-ACP methyl ester carboxylesterase n=1 Tax=Nocardia alba TaxID=225051 RepID=A0A4R1F7X3_9NOCA|nr:alpha/beta fold hydrolase [Nocardia alba]TCJ89700.1 pimeloyl-ACP methyl ester carboxylesterase [Nocardia alba]